MVNIYHTIIRICLQLRRPGFDPWVRKIPLQKGMATHSSIPCLEHPMDRGSWWATVHKVTKSWTQLSDSQGIRVLWG